MIKEKKNPFGFTLTELSFAVLFIAILLLTVALITNQIVGVYRKGVSMKTINQVGREIIEDVRTSITNSPATYSSALDGKTYKSKSTTSLIHSAEANADINPSGESIMLAGVFCTGAYSYIWNTGYFFSSDYQISGSPIDNSRGIKIANLTGFNNGYLPRLLRVSDNGRQVCDIDITPNNATIDFSTISTGNPVELINSEDVTASSRTDAPVAIYDFYISTPPARTTNNGRLFYSGSFILGTTSGGVNIISAGNNCQVPSGQTYANSIFNYCAVNKFNFAVQSSNTR